MSGHIFLSHASSDGGVVKGYSEALELSGHKTWASFKDIRPGESWDRSIEKGLSGAECVLIFCSPSAVESSYVRAEVEAATELSIPVVPVLLMAAEIPIRWKALQWVLAIGRDYETVVRELLEKLPELPVAAYQNALAEANFERLRSLLVYGSLLLQPPDPYLHRESEEFAIPLVLRDSSTGQGLVDLASRRCEPMTMITISFRVWQFIPLNFEPVGEQWISRVVHQAFDAGYEFVAREIEVANRLVASARSWGSGERREACVASINIAIGRRADYSDELLSKRKELEYNLSGRLRTGLDLCRDGNVSLVSYDGLLEAIQKRSSRVLI